MSPTVRHPRALADVPGHPPAAVTVRRESFAVAREDAPATVDLPTESHVRALASAYDLDPAEIRDDAGTCEAVKSDGEVCGRDLPCPYHSED